MSDQLSGPDFGSSKGGPSGWPYGPPERMPGYPDPRTGMPGNSTEPRDEWPRGDAPRQYGQERPAPYRHAAQRERRLLTGRSIAIAALVLVVVAAGAVVAGLRLSPAHHSRAAAGGRNGTTAGSDGTQSASAQSPATTKAQAQQVLSHYTNVNNQANQQFSDSLLGTIEAGSSYAMDAGTYKFQQNTSPPSPIPPFSPMRTVYYIPDQSVHAPYPHWFVAEVTDAELSSPQRSTGTGYLLFSQGSAGAPWLDVSEPFLVSGGSPAPPIATDARGYAIAVSPGGDAAGLSVVPGQLEPMTAAAMDKSGAAAITLPSNLSGLTDEHDRAFWQPRLPAGSTESLTHQAGSGPVFGLQTKGGGAIVFYYVDAQLSLVPPAGAAFNLQIPGFYSASNPVSSAQVPYIDQFAAYDPPRGQAGLRITADTSGYA